MHINFGFCARAFVRSRIFKLEALKFHILIPQGYLTHNFLSDWSACVEVCPFENIRMIFVGKIFQQIVELWVEEIIS